MADAVRTYGGRLKLSKGYSQYGAWMGRPHHTPPIREEGARPRLTLRRVRIDSGGYDAGGAYWGFGAPLYQVSGDNGSDEVVEYYIRAATREDGKQQVLARYPSARVR